MRKIIFIFVLLISCTKEMTVSDALPIQFWPLGDQTFNEKVVGFVDKICHFQEFSCIDPIKLQVSDINLDIVNDYTLKIVDQNDVEITTEAFTKSYQNYGANLQISNGNFDTNPLGVTAANFDGSNRGSSVPFLYSSGVLQAVANLEVDKQNSQYLAINRVDANAALGWPPGDYIIRIRAKNNSTGATDALSIHAWGMTNSSGQTSLSAVSTPSTLVNDNTYRNIDLAFTTTVWWPYIAISAARAGGGGSYNIACYFDSIQIISSVKDKQAFSDISFTAAGLSFCDQPVRFYIQQNGTDAYKSDLIKFNSNISLNQGYGTILISYKSAKNFAGIVYPNDGEYFNIRVPARFFQQRNKSTESSIELSNSKVINLSASLKIQQALITMLLPDYMHNKIELAIAHAVSGSLNIDGYDWTKEESYERNSPDGKSPMQSGKIWLTRKSSLKRNII